MELLFLAILLGLMALALGSGYPVAFALPGASIATICLAAGAGYLFGGGADAYFHQDGPSQWLSAGVTNLRGVYWEVERDTLIAIPLFIFMGIMLQRSKIAEDLLMTMAQLFGPVRGGLGISVVFVGALLAATTGIVGATVVAMGLISLPAMLRNNYSPSLATGTIAASGTLGQIIPPSIVLIILADQLASASDQASTIRKSLYQDSTGELTMPSEFGIVSTSAGEMFLGALVPGLLLVGLYMLYILVYAFFRPKAAPSVPREGALDAEFFFRLGLALVPPLALIFLVLGSILTGVATVNQAGAIGAAGALLMASYRLTEGQRGSFVPALIALASMVTITVVTQLFDTNIKSENVTENGIGAPIVIALVASAALVLSLVWSAWRAYRIDDTLKGVMIETAKATSLVFIILLGAAMLTAAFRAFGGEELVRGFLEGLPGGFWSKFAMVMLVIFLLGFFLDFIEIAVVVVPIVAPILLADPSANITAVWLGVMIGLNIQTSFLTPPFGFALFYLRGVAPAVVRTVSMYKGVIAFIGLQVVALLIVANYPPLVNYLPSRVSYLSETAPPPRNPNLQMCLEDYVLERLAGVDADLDERIAEARTLDYASVPEDDAEELVEGLEQAEEALVQLEAAEAAERAVAEAAPAYRPVHGVVRAIEADIRAVEERIADRRTALSRLRGEDVEAERERRREAIEALELRVEELAATLPEGWEETRSAFAELTRAESQARVQYRRAADGAYAPFGEVAAMLNSTEALAETGEPLNGVRERLVELERAGTPPDALADALAAVSALELSLEDLPGASDVSSGVAGARRALDDDEPDAEEAIEELDEALAAREAELAWRRAVDPDVAATIVSLEARLRETLGIRSQQRMSREQALHVAACNAAHRDVSLNF